jgi:cytochrome bd-type quinol oxidase subunit 1
MKRITKSNLSVLAKAVRVKRVSTKSCNHLLKCMSDDKRRIRERLPVMIHVFWKMNSMIMIVLIGIFLNTVILFLEKRIRTIQYQSCGSIRLH